VGKLDKKIKCPNTNLFWRIQLACCARRMQSGICGPCQTALDAIEGGIGVGLNKKMFKKKKKRKRMLPIGNSKPKKKRRIL